MNKPWLAYETMNKRNKFLSIAPDTAQKQSFETTNLKWTTIQEVTGSYTAPVEHFSGLSFVSSYIR